MGFSKQKQTKYIKKQGETIALKILKNIRYIILIGIIFNTHISLADQAEPASNITTTAIEAKQTTINNSPAIVVEAAKITPATTSNNYESLLNHINKTTAADIFAQGSISRQADISVRGSSFNESGIALAGTNLNNPQTEHFNAELPLPEKLFSQPEILTGVEQALGTSGNLVASVDINILPVNGRNHIIAGGGENDLNWQQASVHIPINEHKTTWSGLFASRAESDGVDYDDNYLNSDLGGFHVQNINSRNSQTDMFYACHKKEFGARGYYGVNDAFFAEEATKDNLLFFSHKTDPGKKEQSSLNILVREFDDNYNLYLPSFLYNNNHKTNTNKISFKNTKKLNNNIYINSRIDIEDESIKSNILQNKYRSRAIITLIPEKTISNTRILAGLKWAMFRNEKAKIMPQAGIYFREGKIIRPYIAYTQNALQPSFTELYYTSPANTNNPDLNTKTSGNYEIGIKGDINKVTTYKTAIFYRTIKNTVDWTKATSPSDKWAATNLGTTNVKGAEIMLSGNVTDKISYNTGYTFIDKSINNISNYYAGRYVIDYAKHKLFIAMNSTISFFKISLSHKFYYQSENPLRNSNRTYNLMSLGIEATPFKNKNTVIAFTCENLLNDDFEVYAGQQSSKRRSSIALKYIW